MRARAAIQAIIAGQAELIYQDQVHHYTLRAMSPGRQHCYSQRRQVVVRRAVQLSRALCAQFGERAYSRVELSPFRYVEGGGAEEMGLDQ